MHLNPAVFDVWVFRKNRGAVEYLLLRTSEHKADTHFNGGRFWQIPSGVFDAADSVVGGIDRLLAPYGIEARAIWAAEHCYTIYNRRFDEMQIIGVYAVETNSDELRLDPIEHSEYAWLPFDEALSRVHYRGLKDGLRSAHEYIAGVEEPARELRLR